MYIYMYAHTQIYINIHTYIYNIYIYYIYYNFFCIIYIYTYIYKLYINIVYKLFHKNVLNFLELRYSLKFFVSEPKYILELFLIYITTSVLLELKNPEQTSTSSPVTSTCTHTLDKAMYLEQAYFFTTLSKSLSLRVCIVRIVPPQSKKLLTGKD